MSIYMRMCRYIENNAISLEDLAEKSGISRKRIQSVFERYADKPSVDEYINLCAALGKTLDFFRK